MVILHRTFHNAVHIIGLAFIRIDLVLIQTAKGIQPAVSTAVNGNIVWAVCSRVVYRFPVCIVLAGCQTALELDVDCTRPVLCSKVLTICIFPELIELNVDQCALGVGKDCGKFRIVRIFALLNHAFHHGVVFDHMGGFATIRNGYALQFGTIVASDFLDDIAGTNGDAGDGSGAFALNRNGSFDGLFFQTLTANIIKGNFEGVGSGQGFALCGLLLDFQPAGFDGVDVFYL